MLCYSLRLRWSSRRSEQSSELNEDGGRRKVLREMACKYAVFLLVPSGGEVMSLDDHCLAVSVKNNLH
jgi:hypothetical protein